MNKFIIFALFTLFAFALSEKCPMPPVENGKCKCSTKINYVCGISGRTHNNKCLAKCFNDKVAYEGECSKKCLRTSTVEKKCSFVKFGDNGIRKYCCTNNKVCFGKKCARTNFQCLFSGKVIRKIPKSHCKWIKQGNKRLQKCCSWLKRCVGEVCKDLKKTCRFKGLPVTFKNSRRCEWKRSPVCQDGFQKYCCRHRQKCVGGKCSQEKKGKCYFSGPVVTKKLKYTCKWTKVGKHGQRRECCANTFKCYADQCKLQKKECKTVGWTIVKKTVKKCATRRFGRNARRKRCCQWKIQCFNKKCTTLSKSCAWDGPAVLAVAKRRCKMVKVAKDKRQKECCDFKKRCVNKVCKIFDKKCKREGPIVSASYNHKCKVVFVPNAKAYRKQCCSWERHCQETNCKNQKAKCSYVGPFMQVKKMKKCENRAISKGASCKFCCSWEIQCVGKKCKETKKVCKCQSNPIYREKKQSCVFKKKSKNSKQRFCCDYTLECRSGPKKNCKKTKQTCHYVGFPIVTKVTRSCTFKVFQGKKQQYCCRNFSICQGKKCSSRQKCNFTGKVLVHLKRSKCQMKNFSGNARRKFCCRWVDKCNGTKCEKINYKCDYEGPLYQTFFLQYPAKKACGKLEKGKRDLICTKKKMCKNEKPETCNPMISKCLFCRESKPKCVSNGPCKTEDEKVEVTLRQKSKGIFQQYRCVTKTTCINDKCTKGKKICAYAGPIITQQIRNVCTYKKDNKLKRERKFCCKSVQRCVAGKCAQIKKACAYSGPWVSLKKHTICKYVPWKKVKTSKNCETSFLRKVCCLLHIKCINDKCVNKSKKCKYYHVIEKTKRKKCSWKVVSPKKCNTIKQKVCTSWVEICKRNSRHGKRVCKKENVKTQIVKNATVRITCKRQCKLRFFGECQKRRYCCTKQTVCYGEKCHTFNKNCSWVGQPTKCCRSNTIYRWRTICREQNWRVTKTREQCCRVYQRCDKITNYFRCSVVKTLNCYWSGAARGDVHLLGADGKWHTLNVAGDFKYFADPNKNLEVYLQFKQVGSGSETSAITFVTNGNIMKAENGKVFINGKETTTFPVSFGKGKLEKHVTEVDKKEQSTFLLTGYGDERLAFVRQADGSYTINVGIKVGKHVPAVGLMYDMKNPQKYALTKEQSSKYFTTPIDYKVIVQKPKVSQVFAEKCCQKIKEESASRYQQCVTDTRASGKCYIHTYLQTNEKQVKEKLTKDKH